MLFALVYSCLRLLLDVVDVRLRVRDPEAELLLLRHQLRVVRRQMKRPDLEAAARMIMAALSRVVSRADVVLLLVVGQTYRGRLCRSTFTARDLRRAGRIHSGGGVPVQGAELKARSPLVRPRLELT